MNQQSRTRVLGWLGGLICLSLLSPPIAAQDWARGMFEITEHDFGTIARGGQGRIWHYIGWVCPLLGDLAQWDWAAVLLP